MPSNTQEARWTPQQRSCPFPRRRQRRPRHRTEEGESFAEKGCCRASDEGDSTLAEVFGAVGVEATRSGVGASSV